MMIKQEYSFADKIGKNMTLKEQIEITAKVFDTFLVSKEPFTYNQIMNEIQNSYGTDLLPNRNTITSQIREFQEMAIMEKLDDSNQYIALHNRPFFGPIYNIK